MYITICLYHFSHYEKHQVCNLSINKSRMLFERKRKRQVLEEEDEISADEMEKLKKEMDGFPTDFVLPKDTTGTSTAHDMYMMHGLFTIIHQFATCEICACSPQAQDWTPPADPVILVEADGNVDTQKALKALSFPVMDDDALPSSYIQKVLGALAKWRVKMNGIIETLDSLEEKPDNVQPLLLSNSWHAVASSYLVIPFV